MKIGHIDLGERPIFLAPMEDVTDPAFRLMCKKFGADMVYTEFVSADALIRSVSKTEQKLNISDEERAMMADMPTDEEFMLIETLKLATLRERRYMALLARYNELLKNSPDGMILKEDIRVLTKESNAFGKCVSSKQHQTVTAQQTKVDAIEQMQIIESELTRVQKLKIKTLEALSKIRAEKATDGDSELIDDWIKAVEGCEDDD